MGLLKNREKKQAEEYDGNLLVLEETLKFTIYVHFQTHDSRFSYFVEFV